MHILLTIKKSIIKSKHKINFLNLMLFLYSMMKYFNLNFVKKTLNIRRCLAEICFHKVSEL